MNEQRSFPLVNSCVGIACWGVLVWCWRAVAEIVMDDLGPNSWWHKSRSSEQAQRNGKVSPEIALDEVLYKIVIS